MISHEGSGAALRVRALLPQPLNLARIINLVKLEKRELDFLVLVLDLLWLRVGLLLAFFGAAAEAEDEVEGGLLLDVVVGEGAAVLELFTGEEREKREIVLRVLGPAEL
ncbi:hypothetical protein RIF29_04237 [Crotalaria pallida]|uniref:Uncharacterized protein n=1 Tax=Crotalaria pallida TaxID=3830 RepID=A0AAN9PA97_CROPI